MINEISLQEARRIAVASQRLTQEQTTTHSVAELIDHLGYLQIDTISVVARTHEHTMWTRLQDFTPSNLYAAQRDDRSIFEYWGHAMSYLPIRDFRYYLPTMKAFHNHDKGWAKDRYERCGQLIEPVMDRIKAEGPIRSRDFEQKKSKEQRTWWNWHPEKMVLELLLWRGDLMVTERQGFQKVYDLTERVLPDWVDTRYPTDEEIGRFIVERTLQAYGLASEKDMRGFMHEFNNDVVRLGLSSLMDEKRLREVSVEGLPGPYYLINDASAFLPDKGSKTVRILSPFDNFIIQRERIAQLFNFQYTLECYLPAAKRKYGYYVMPILYRDKLVARMDPKADRKANVFLVRNLFLEDEFQPDDTFFSLFAEQLRGMMQFNGCKQIRVEGVSHEQYLAPLLQALKGMDVLDQSIQ